MDNVKNAVDRLQAALRIMSDFNAGRLLGFGMAMAELGAAPKDEETQRRAIGASEKETA